MWRHAWHRTGLLQLVSSSMFVCVDDPRPGTASFARIAQRSAEPDEVIDQLKWTALIPGRSAISAPKLCVCWRASPHDHACMHVRSSCV